MRLNSCHTKLGRPLINLGGVLKNIPAPTIYNTGQKKRNSELRIFPLKDLTQSYIVMSPGKLTFNCVDLNKMSIERAFYCNSVPGLFCKGQFGYKYDLS